MSARLPFEIREAVVQVCGKAFWLKDPFRGFLLSRGVPTAIYDRYSDESKYKIARHVLAELDAMGEDGFQAQRRIVTELAKLRKAPDESIPNTDAALSALRYLKELAVNQKLFIEDERRADDTRAQEARRKQAALAARAQKMEELRRTFNGWAGTKDDPQSRGYGLEDLLAELFELHEIRRASGPKRGGAMTNHTSVRVSVFRSAPWLTSCLRPGHRPAGSGAAGAAASRRTLP